LSAQEMCEEMKSTRFFHYPTGAMCIPEDAWSGAVETLRDVQRGMFDEVEDCGRLSNEHRWILPLVAHCNSQGYPSGIVDVGGGASTLTWLMKDRGVENRAVIDMLPYHKYADGTLVLKNQMLDLDDLRRGIESIPWKGGMLCCTEVLEHLQYNPMPSLLLITERLKTDFVYLTAPNYLYPDKFMLDNWRHYSELPIYRGQKFSGACWHYKPWTIDEISELVGEIGYDVMGSFAGWWRVGIIGRRRM